MKIYKISKRFLSVFIIFSLLLLTFSVSSYCQLRVRTEVNIPDIPGYLTLKCDFHMHTVFSDGSVWPTIRVDEVWREGLDAFSITDHIEYLPHKDDIQMNHNRPYEIARPGAEALNLLFIRGAEITRDMPPGHFNAIFLNDANPLDKEDYRDGLKAAFDQGAFIFWNHPSFPHPERIEEWFPNHEEAYKNGWMHGIEVANGSTYYPKAHQWCIEKNLTMLGTSDVHNPINLDYNFASGQHRPMTLVFVKERTPAEIKKALFNRRTAVYWRNFLIGEEKYLKPIFENTVEIKKSDITVRGNRSAYIQISNKSDVNYELTANGKVEGISVPANITLYAGKTVIFGIRGRSKTMSGKKSIAIPYKVKNLLVAPEEGLPVELKINVTFIPVER